MKSFFAPLIFIFLISLTAFAAEETTAINPESSMPLEITADHTLEWHRNEQRYIASGNAVAKQGDMVIKADTITAHYRETENSAFDIYRLTASGNVRIESRGNTGRGDDLVYDIDRGVATMTGKNISLASPNQSIAARDSFEYWVVEGKLNALGNVRVLRGEDRITADSMTAYLQNNKITGKREIKRMIARDNVVITTPTEILTGDQGEYNAATNIATMTGNVKITRGPNVLEGNRAEINLTTNISKMFGGTVMSSPLGTITTNTTATGRVRGVFYPKSQEKPDTSRTSSFIQ